MSSHKECGKENIRRKIKKVIGDFRVARGNIEKTRIGLNEAAEVIDENIPGFEKLYNYYGRYYVRPSGPLAGLHGGTLVTTLISACKVSNEVRKRSEALSDVENVRFVTTVTTSGSIKPVLTDITKTLATTYGSDEAKEFAKTFDIPTPYDNQRDLGSKLSEIDMRLKTKLDGAWQTLKDRSKKDRFLQATSSMRDLISDTLQVLAPDEVIVRRPWFKPETDDGRPSHRQRARYAMVGKNDAIEYPDLIAINELSKYWWVLQKTKQICTLKTV